MESEAHEFQQAVIACLDGTIPILGVVKPTSTPFLEQVHKHFHTTLMEVTEQNREHVLAGGARARVPSAICVKTKIGAFKRSYT